MKTRKTPYQCHLFVCLKFRGGERKSCGDGESAEIKALLKDAISNRGWKGTVRISDSGCLGVCGVGPNVMIYPQGTWLTQVTPADVPEILKTIELLINE